MLTISLKSPLLRVVFLITLSVPLVWVSRLIVRAAIGNSFATFARRAEEVDETARLEAADIALRYAADDPDTRRESALVHFSAAVTSNADEPDKGDGNLAAAIRELLAAARISPEDYRVWLALGRAEARSPEGGTTAQVRQALERAVQLAPQHFEPRWALGNFLLRTGDREAALATLQVPMINRPDLFPLIFNSLWDAYQGDVPALLGALRLPRAARTQLAVALASRGQLPEALAAWKEADQTAANAKLMVETLFANQYYAAAFDLWRHTQGTSVPQRDKGSLLANGDFDQEITVGTTTPFLAWQVIPRNGVSLSLDDRQTSSGRYSLRIGFDAHERGEFVLVQQHVPVSPSTGYRLSFAVRTQELKSFSLPLVEVIDTAGAGRLSAAGPIPEQDSNWHESTIDFTTKPSTEAVTVRIARRACAESPCPLTGRIWFDNLKLVEVKK
ncbi:MAG TPA: hypothetical protein VFD58_15465 [Blastocatellia bacterium]|nr:hypothetical protein [Blastocatellia bacterium]